MSFQNNQQKSPQRRFLFVFGFVRIAFFLILGLLILFTDFFASDLAPTYKYILGGALILYGIGRLYIAITSSEDN